MAATAGKTLRVKFSTTAGGAGSYTAAAGVRSATMTWQGQNVDVSELTSDDVARILGQRDTTYRLEGNYEADASGQGTMPAALTAGGSELWFQFLPTGTTGWKQQVLVGSYEVSGEIGGKISFSAELQGTGAKAAV